MTKKRFTRKDEDVREILDRNEHFAYAHSGCQAEKIIQELNELVETNRELYEDNKQLKKENEQLKQVINKNEKIIFEPIIFEGNGKSVTLYKKKVMWNDFNIR